MISFEELLNPSFKLIPICRRVLQESLLILKSEKIKLKIPRLGDERKKIKEMHFHSTPETFIQISGLTLFEFPREKFSIYPEEVCIVPRGIPHFETVKKYKGPFFYMVVMFHDQTISFHIGNESKRTPEHPDMLQIEHFQAENSKRILGYLDDLCNLFWKDNFENRAAVMALLTVYFCSLLRILNEENPVNLSGNIKVGLCKKLIISNLSDPKLSVQTIAEWIGCSPDYLSYLFHKESGEYLVGYLNNQRVNRAKNLLETSLLNISEIAWACGYYDAGYFARLFKKTTGKTPKEYRQENYVE